MTDFKVMFPSMDADVIEAVLRANGGAVDATIDNLLTMSADAETEKLPPEEDVGNLLTSFQKGAKVDNPPSYQQATSKWEQDDLINLSGSQDTVFVPDSTPRPVATTVEKSPEVDLLSDLNILGAAGGVPKHSYTHPARVEAEKEEHEEREQASSLSIIPTQQQLQEIYEENLRQRESSRFSSESAARAQFLEDERVALMLQNEEFMSELRRDQEFMCALEMEGGRAGHLGAEREDGALMQRGAKNPMMDEAVFREKLKNMGQKSKRKFAQLAGMFSRRKGAKQLLDQAHDDNLLLNAEPLVQEDSDDERQETKGGKTPTKGKYTSLL